MPLCSDVYTPLYSEHIEPVGRQRPFAIGEIRLSIVVDCDHQLDDGDPNLS